VDSRVFDFSPLEQYQPIWIGDDCCVCLGDVQPPDKPAVCFFLQSPSYFGTGGHPFTKAILLALYDMDFTGMSVLDYRAGSGLLGIYCARFGAKEVVSHNETAREFERAAENSMVNDIRITPATKTEMEITSAQAFDMVVCQQITPKSAREDVQFLSKVIAQNGCAILTGWEAKQHQFIRGIVEEFFIIKLLADLDGYPIMKVEK